MDFALLVTLGGIALLPVLLALLIGVVLSGRRRVRRELDTALADLEALRTRLDELSAQVSTGSTIGAGAVALKAEYLITDAGVSTGSTNGVGSTNGSGSTNGVGSTVGVVLGEHLIKLVCFGYGVRRALSAENRNRIAFEMRREVKRSRKQRRRELKDARRDSNAAQRTAEVEALDNQEDAA